jgi:hypothetical protein
MLNLEPAYTLFGQSGLAQDAGRYQHSACTRTEIFGRRDIFVLCINPKCPNKGANWVQQEKLT